MALFGFGKKKDAEKAPCCCQVDGDAIQAAQQTQESASSVKVLGGGCAKCNQLEAATKTALENLGMDTTIEHVTDFSVIATYGVMTTPALVVDGKVLSFGKVLKVAEAEALIKNARG